MGATTPFPGTGFDSRVVQSSAAVSPVAVQAASMIARTAARVSGGRTLQAAITRARSRSSETGVFGIGRQPSVQPSIGASSQGVACPEVRGDCRLGFKPMVASEKSPSGFDSHPLPLAGFAPWCTRPQPPAPQGVVSFGDNPFATPCEAKPPVAAAHSAALFRSGRRSSRLEHTAPPHLV